MKRRQPVPIGIKALVLAALLACIIFGGGLIYRWIEPSFSYLDAVYSVIMIMTGIGATKDAQTSGGKVFNMILALISVGILVSVLGQMFRYFSSRSLKEIYEEIHDRKVKAMQGHVIICGTSATLHELLRQMEHRDHAWVIVRTEAEAGKLEADGFHAHIDDYTSAAAMRKAGIETAGCVIACSDNDAENAFITLTAKNLRKSVPVIVRLTRMEHREKLKAAGADEIVVPAELAAMQIRDALRGMVGDGGAVRG